MEFLFQHDFVDKQLCHTELSSTEDFFKCSCLQYSINLKIITSKTCIPTACLVDNLSIQLNSYKSTNQLVCNWTGLDATKVN